MAATLTGLILGVLLGMRHALEPDHLTAVSTLMADARGPSRGAVGATLGALWGLGHSLALLTVGLLLAALHAELPPRLADGFELLVAALLLFLGARNLQRAFAERGPTTLHQHGETAHVHAGPPLHLHLGRYTLGRRSLVIGLIHGLAGSGALTAFVAANLPTVSARLAYIALFGLGSIAGMALLSGAAGFSLERLMRGPRTARVFTGLTGGLSAALGVAWGWPLLTRLLP